MLKNIINYEIEDIFYSNVLLFIFSENLIFFTFS